LKDIGNGVARRDETRGVGTKPTMRIGPNPSVRVRPQPSRLLTAQPGVLAVVIHAERLERCLVSFEAGTSRGSTISTSCAGLTRASITS
jgi:hypothetical protein